MRFCLLFLFVLLSGCSSDELVVDQGVRVELYYRCMASSPETATLDGWAKALALCNTLSYGQATRLKRPSEACP